MPKIYDCCMFFQELDMLELRMNILEDVVDYFVVCEAPETHSGQPKPFVFWDNLERFAKWENKIIYLRTDKLTDHSDNSWLREKYHRGYIANGLTGARGDDLIVVSDTDEIVNPDVLGSIADGAMLELAFYYYSLNRRVKQGWAVGAMRWGLEKDPNKIRTGEGHDFPHIDNGGVHLSYFGGPQQVISKVDAFMHANDPVIRDLPRDPKYIADRMARGVDLYGRDMQIDYVPLADNLPRYILEHVDQYKSMGWIEQ